MSFAAMRRRRTGALGSAGTGWRSLLRPYPYTTPQFANGTTAIDAYGRGTVIDTTWALTAQTGTVRVCTTQADVTAAVAAANPGDIIKVSADIGVQSIPWDLGNRGAGTIYLVTDYVYNLDFGGGTAFERRASVSDWGTLSLTGWAAEIAACRARKADTYRILTGNTANSGVRGVFAVTASASPTRWVVAGFALRPNPASTLVSEQTDAIIYVRDAGIASFSTMAGNVWFNRCKVYALATQNLHSAFAVDGVNVAITDSVICELHSTLNPENQAFTMSVGRGIKLVNNTMDGTGQHVLFGGNPISGVSIQAQDVEIRACHMVTPNGYFAGDSLYSTGPWAGKNYTGKQPFESKFCNRVWMEGCTVDGARTNTSSFGFAYTIQSAPQYDGNNLESNNWAVRQMRFRNVQGALNLGSSGYLVGTVPGVPRTDFRRSTASRRVHVLDTLITESGGSFPVVLYQDGYDSEIYGLTADGAWNKFLDLQPTTVSAGTLTIRGVASPYGTYGVFASGGLTGRQAFDTYRSGLVDWQNNVLYGPNANDATSLYNGSCPTALLTTRAAVGFIDPTTNQWDVSGTYATEKCNATLVRALTDPVAVETYP